MSGFDKGNLPMPPARKVAVVACLDARLHPEKVLGLEIGDAHGIRNAGGRVQDAIRSLVISERLLGTTEIVVLHHTDCGMLTFTNDQLADKVQADLGVDVHGQDFYHSPILNRVCAMMWRCCANHHLFPKTSQSAARFMMLQLAN